MRGLPIPSSGSWVLRPQLPPWRMAQLVDEYIYVPTGSHGQDKLQEFTLCAVPAATGNIKLHECHTDLHGCLGPRHSPTHTLRWSLKAPTLVRTQHAL
jgi:hypothetical protein